MTERERFEQAMLKTHPSEHLMRFEPDGEYVEPAMRHRYEGWLAAERDHANKAIEALTKT